MTELAHELVALSRLSGLPAEVQYREMIGSTNAEMKEWAKEGASHGSALVAGTQTEGRGRLGRTWDSIAGHSLTMSVLLRPDRPPKEYPLLALATAVAVREVIGDQFRFKWPNDLLAPDGRKVAGVLLEADPNAGYVVVGIGVNVLSAPSALPMATSVKAVTNHENSIADLAVKFVESLLKSANLSADDIVSRWRAGSAMTGRMVRIGAVEGLVVDIDRDGALLVNTGDAGVKKVMAGEIEMVVGLQE